MSSFRFAVGCVGLMLMLTGSLLAAEPRDRGVIDEMLVEGRIEGANISFALDFEILDAERDHVYPLITADAVLQKIDAGAGSRAIYDAAGKSYSLRWSEAGSRKVHADFAVRPSAVQEGGAAGWREATLSVPVSRVRNLRVICDRADLEVQFPGALRLERATVEGKLVVTAILGPGKPVLVRWKPQVQQLEAELMLSAQMNTIARISAGALRLDSMVALSISQGKLSELTFDVPAGLSITQVRGEHIRDWKLLPAAAVGAAQRLSVQLNQPQALRYDLQILGETALPKFPAAVSLPTLALPGNIRTAGHLAIGCDSAIQLVVKETSGLTQIDAPAFPRQERDPQHPRPLPSSSAFYYSFASSSYTLRMALDDIVPAYDASHRLVATVREDDLIVEAQIELEIRDAAMRGVNIEVPTGYALASLTGDAVEDFTARPAVAAGSPSVVQVHFKQPVIGRTLIALRLELGQSPLGSPRVVRSPSVQGAASQRGYAVVVCEEGVQLDKPEADGLREVHTGSVPITAAGAQLAYRYRDTDWKLTLSPTRKSSGIRAEAFHLVSLGEGVAYGSVAVNYFISGAPVDELQFTVPAELGAVEFVGQDVRRWVQDGQKWTVKLSRKVVGDYNLGVFYRQRYGEGAALLVGAVECVGVETQTGYIAMTSHLNVQVEPTDAAGTGLLEISRDEVPANYRLLLGAPVLRTWKFVQSPHRATLKVATLPRGDLPPTVVELMQAHTDLAVDDAGRAESITHVRYKLKNTTSQFLELSMPDGATVWSTELIDQEGTPGERRQRVISSFDAAKKLLMIPLPRKRNPNDPTTLDLQYAQPHGSLGWVGHLDLAAPRSDVRSTFASWSVATPREWSVHPVDAAGTPALTPEQRDTRHGNLWLILRRVGAAWENVFNTLTASYLWLFLAAGAAGIVTLAALINRAAIVPTVKLLILLAVALAGIIAANAPGFLGQLSTPDDLTHLAYSQPLSFDPAHGVTIHAAIVPAWRQHATFTGSVLVPAAGLAALVLAMLIRKLRVPLLALGATAILFGLGEFDVIRIGQWSLPIAAIIGHVLTWVIPVLLLAWALVHTGRKIGHAAMIRPAPGTAATATTALLALMMLTASGCGTTPIINVNVDNTVVLDSAECHLIADKDSVRVNYKLHVVTKDPLKFQLTEAGAILSSPARPAADVHLVEEDGWHVVHLERGGTYDLDIQFLAPLGVPGEDLAQRFAVRMPLALTNSADITLPSTGLQVESPSATRFEQREQDGTTIASAIGAPGEEIAFNWKPRLRQTHLEKTVFFAEVTSLFYLDTALATAQHRMHLQIAQGELSEMRVKLPAGMTVVSAAGPLLGAWRFDPATHLLEARFAQPITGEYDLRLVTQVAGGATPWSATLGVPIAVDASSHRGSIGLVASPAVYLQIDAHPQAISTQDFARAAAALMPQRTDGTKPPEVQSAYRADSATDLVTLKVFEVRPELRSAQTGTFSVSDERLIYGGELTLDVAKAGVFGAELRLPAGYDIDTLSAPEVSHWDETLEGGVRVVQVHFQRKLLGPVTLKLALSQPVSELPPQIPLPRVQVTGTIKHTGTIVVTAERGVRVSIAERDGVSEANPAEMGIGTPGALALRLLRPDWKLTLATEVLEPRITVDFLHVAQVSEALVRHTHMLRYHLANAGVKVLDLTLPPGAMGVAITGPQIASVKQVDAAKGTWHIELAKKWFDRPYPLTVRYEKQFNLAAGAVPIEPVIAAGGDLYRGSIVIRTTDQVEITAQSVGPTLQGGDARNIDRQFGAGDLSDAALTYTTTRPEYQLTLAARRHDAAALLEADVLRTAIQTVVSEEGRSITSVQMDLRVGAKRNLAVRLPMGASIWALMVNRRAVAPSLDGDRLAIPIAQSGAGELPVAVEFIYALPAMSPMTTPQQIFQGPQFDVPLKDVEWVFYVPADFKYTHFEGTMNVNRELVQNARFSLYNAASYQAELAKNMADENRIAVGLQDRGRELAQQGRQWDAKQALESAYNYSFNDAALNEDARVQLHRLSQQQAIVGLKSRRAYLRPQSGSGTATPGTADAQDAGDRFSLSDAEREISSLDRFDSENLERITARIIAAQDAAAGLAVPLTVNLPARGRVLQFTRPLQVKPDSEMTVSFEAKRNMPAEVTSAAMSGGVLFIAMLIVIGVAPRLVNGRRAA